MINKKGTSTKDILIYFGFITLLTVIIFAALDKTFSSQMSSGTTAYNATNITMMSIGMLPDTVTIQGILYILAFSGLFLVVTATVLSSYTLLKFLFKFISGTNKIFMILKKIYNNTIEYFKWGIGGLSALAFTSLSLFGIVPVIYEGAKSVDYFNLLVVLKNIIIALLGISIVYLLISGIGYISKKIYFIFKNKIDKNLKKIRSVNK